jgi:two-component system, OmpR family, response regulator
MVGVLERVLYVDDDPDIRAVGTFALEGVGGFTVKGCASGAEAVAAVALFAPQIILLDVMMPGMDGPTTLIALRAVEGSAATPVVFMTAKVQPAEVARYRELGAVDVIPKPFDPMTLATEIRAIYERAN